MKWCKAAQVGFPPNGYIFEFGGNGWLGWPDLAGLLYVELIPTVVNTIIYKDNILLV